ncbi:DNA damage-inducible transcript 4 protein-like [Gouania willdenowi]|uniref:DNA damage-inducible transcript 4 protein n=1 Tax=Gouania willdenowi TaxID=441366 RepID=A0A8C5HF96_GOUWI|nr:DNA damage-inducible transcript 4 protein-like [Gouania willdenowi]
MSWSFNHSLDGSCPPSPVEDRGSQGLSWGTLLHRLTEVKGTSQRLTTGHICNIETGSVADLSLSDSDCSFFYPLEESLAADVSANITQSLRDSSQLLGCCELMLPDCLLRNVSLELLHLSETEPCGLRGALIDLCVDKGKQGSPCTVDQIAVDPSLVPTFHVTLVLRLEPCGLWPKVQKLFNRGKPTQMSSTCLLSPSFRAIKRKLYSSEHLVIEECCCAE